jgi:hypothetical protein
MRGDQLSCQAEIILVLQYAKPCQNAQKTLWVEVKTHGYNKSQIFFLHTSFSKIGQKYFLLFRFCSHRYIYIYILKSVFTYLNLVNFLFIEKYFF